jgi:hypothetical protein
VAERNAGATWEQHAPGYVHLTPLPRELQPNEVMMQIRKPTRLPTRSTSVVVPGRSLAAWEDEVTARYDVEGLRRDALLLARCDRAEQSAPAPSSGVTPVDVVEVTFDPRVENDVPLYVLKGLLTCYTEFMGAAAKPVLKQEMLKLGVTPQNIQRSQLPTLVGRLATRLDTRAASDGFLRAVRLVDPALSTF